MKRIKRYLKNILIALDQLAGTILGGEPDMTISAQAWLWDIQGRRQWPRQLIDTLFWWDKNHCCEAWKSEVERKQVPEEARKQN